MDNFDYKKYLSEGKLFEEETVFKPVAEITAAQQKYVDKAANKPSKPVKTQFRKDIEAAKRAMDAGRATDDEIIKKYGIEAYNAVNAENEYLEEGKLTEDFPGKGEIVKAEDLNYDMLDYFDRMNVKLLINTKSKKNIKGSVGIMFNDLVFNGGDIDKKDIVSVKIDEV